MAQPEQQKSFREEVGTNVRNAGLIVLVVGVIIPELLLAGAGLTVGGEIFKGTGKKKPAK